MKNVHQIAPLIYRIFQILFTSEGTPRLPLSKAVSKLALPRKIQNYWKTEMKRSTLIFIKKRVANQQNRSICSILFKIFLIDRELCMIKNGDDTNVLGTIATFAPSDRQGWLRACYQMTLNISLGINFHSDMYNITVKWKFLA